MQKNEIDSLYQTILERKDADPTTSWTAKLFSKGIEKIAQKVGEEAVETVIASVANKPDEVITESADLLYHLCVLWAKTGVTPEQVFNELHRRQGVSGITEKNNRPKE